MTLSTTAGCIIVFAGLAGFVLGTILFVELGFVLRLRSMAKKNPEVLILWKKLRGLRVSWGSVEWDRIEQEVYDKIRALNGGDFSVHFQASVPEVTQTTWVTPEDDPYDGFYGGDAWEIVVLSPGRPQLIEIEPINHSPN